MLLAQLLQEILHGVDTYTTARQRREHGNWQVPMALAVDAMSVFAAVTATQLKIPTERSLWSHVQYLRELLDTGVLKYLWWIDTRDMWADGLTKGSVDRQLLQELMGGILKLRHTAKSWKPRQSGVPSPLPLATIDEDVN